MNAPCIARHNALCVARHRVPRRSCFRRSISAAWSTSSLISATLVTLATRWANLHVLIDSSVCARPGCIVATMTVLQFPPSESRSTCDK